MASQWVVLYREVRTGRIFTSFEESGAISEFASRKEAYDWAEKHLEPNPFLLMELSDL